MITVYVKYFNILASHAGTSEQSFTIQEGTTIHQLIKHLANRHSAAFTDFLLTDNEISSYIRVFRNRQEITPAEIKSSLENGDQVMLFPAVAGG